LWASYELGSAGPNDLSDLGTGVAGLAELNYWGQAAWHLGLVQAALGGIRYTFAEPLPTAGRTRADNTTELYVDLRGTSKYIVPGVALWLDVDRVRGAYIEGSITVPVLANPLAEAVRRSDHPGRPWVTRSARRVPTSRAPAFTHVDFAASSDVTLHPLRVPTVLRLEGHLHSAPRCDPAHQRSPQ